MRKAIVILFCYMIGQQLSAQYNVIKFNVAGLAFGDYSFQIERVVWEERAFAFSAAFIPNGKLPTYVAGDDVTLKNMKFNGFSLMPEFRFYPVDDKDPPRGPYIGFYGKFSKYNFNTVFQPQNVTVPGTYGITGLAKAYGGGIGFGVQWIAWKHLSIDWMILGIHGGGTNITADIKQTIPTVDQQAIKDQLDGIKFPLDLGDVKSTVTNSGANMKVEMPFLGFRGGLSIGFAF